MTEEYGVVHFAQDPIYARRGKGKVSSCEQWIKAFYRQPDHLPRVRATTERTCAVRTQRDKCEAMCKHYQHQNLADTDH